MRMNYFKLQPKHIALLTFTTLMFLLMVVAAIGSQKSKELRSKAAGCDPNDKYQDCNVSKPGGCTRDGGTPDNDTPCCSGCSRGGKCVSCGDTGGSGLNPQCREECGNETVCEGCWEGQEAYDCQGEYQGNNCPDTTRGCKYVEKCKYRGGTWRQCCEQVTKRVCKQVCSQPPPPCDANAWGGWGACSVQCGGGTQTRINACGTSQSQVCNNQPCSPTATSTPTPPPPTATPVPTRTPTPTPTPGVCPRKAVGDANCSGKVDGVDYSLWLNSQCHPAAGQTCNKTDADFNKDGNTDDADYQIWFTNRNT